LKAAADLFNAADSAPVKVSCLEYPPRKESPALGEQGLSLDSDFFGSDKGIFMQRMLTETEKLEIIRAGVGEGTREES
jgi:hypothetical protein